jgi:hypothetical protein
MSEKGDFPLKFRQFVDILALNGQFVGQCNPKADILIIGKESAAESGDEWYKSNALKWKESEIGAIGRWNYQVSEGYLFNSWGKNTWSNYQKLIDCIFGTDLFARKEVNFEGLVFTTELNSGAAKASHLADKSSITDRKRIFKESEFIQGFKVVVLACKTYIMPNEVQDIFGIKQEKDSTQWFSKFSDFEVYRSEDKQKLVLRTRQLSSNIHADLIPAMAKVISNHLKRTK